MRGQLQKVAEYAQRRRRRWWVRAVGLLAVVAVVVVFAFAIWAAAWLLPPMLVQHQLATRSTVSETDRLKEIDAVRTSLLGPTATLIAATAVLAGAVVAYLNFRGTLELNRRGQVTERFSKAIDQLGERGEEEFEKLDIRLGAIYALEQIARDSPELHWPIVEILTAFIREHTKAGAGAKPGSDQPDQEPATRYKVAADIQAVLTVLGRRNPNNDRGQVVLAGANLQGANLSEANLQGADLRKANLQGANLVKTSLQRAHLREAHLRDADLEGANLDMAILWEANLQGANLREANLQRAYLREAHLRDADLEGANLDMAILWEANLQGANLNRANLELASLREANLPGAKLQAHLKFADFREANLQGANLSEANLYGARLDDANLQGAGLRGANLQGAVLEGANLQGAVLEGANLQDAYLATANLQGARLGTANLQGARLRGANLQGADGLTQKQLDSASCDDSTRLPPGLTARSGNEH